MLIAVTVMTELFTYLTRVYYSVLVSKYWG
jgi:hypothetical protein